MSSLSKESPKKMKFTKFLTKHSWKFTLGNTVSSFTAFFTDWDKSEVIARTYTTELLPNGKTITYVANQTTVESAIIMWFLTTIMVGLPLLAGSIGIAITDKKLEKELKKLENENNN